MGQKDERNSGDSLKEIYVFLAGFYNLLPPRQPVNRFDTNLLCFQKRLNLYLLPFVFKAVAKILL